MKESPYVIGIDLGTTNTALTYVDTTAGGAPRDFAIPQVVTQGAVEERPLLPSFLYLPMPGEQPKGSLKLPWDKERDFAVGEYARNFGSLVPTRLASSAKSWLCHPGVDRKSAVLPWKAAEDGRKVSPVEASARYLKHLVEAWDQVIAQEVPAQRLKKQDIVLTVPASFDAAARDLTVEAAKAAGLDNITLLEEPQAAFYAWLASTGDQWREHVKVGDVVLVVDVGGGTTDLTLIGVGDEAGNLVLTRLAVGDHILLGGDNMDLTLAHHVAAGLAAKGTKLDAGQMHALWHSCRAAKELLFANPKLAGTPVTILGRGSKVIGGTIQAELTRKDVEKVLVEGFFPVCEITAEPARQHGAGLQELGLPYASDPAITRHLASFISRNAEVFGKKKKAAAIPSAVLFNGGVFKAGPLQERMIEVLNGWARSAGAPEVKVLPGTHLDLAVARGAAYYGMVRRGKGVRIRGGTARSYYIGVETSMPAVPGALPPIKALCVAPFGMEEGSEADVPGQEFGLIVGAPVQFRFLGSSTRRGDAVGTILDEWDEQITELAPVATTLDAAGKEGKTVPVHLHSKVTEVGTLELWCISRDGKQKWKLEYNVRERGE